METTQKPEKAVYTVDEVAAVLGIGRLTAYEHVKSGAIPSIRLGRRILIPKAALERMLAGAAVDGDLAA